MVSSYGDSCVTELKETYLGDGLYASFDGFLIILRAPREHGDHWVGLDPYVWNNLLEFVNKLSKENK
jgi:hypothetical protein